MLAGQKNAFEVVIDLRVPHLFAHLHRTAFGRTAHVVDQDIDPAQALDAQSHGRCQSGAVGDIASQGDELAAGRFNQLGCLLHALGVAVYAHHLRALFGKAHRDGPPIAPAGTD